jgi:hypothetical protein
LPFAAPLLCAGDETSGDDEVSVVPPIVGHAPSRRPSRPPPSPPPRGQGLDQVRRMKTCVAPDGKTAWGRDWARFSTPAPPNGIWGSFRGGEWRCSKSIFTGDP